MKKIKLVWLACLLPLAGCSTLLSFLPHSANGPKPTPLKPFKASATANVLWKTNVGASSLFNLVPVVDGDAIFAANDRGYLTRIDAATGRTVWQVKVADQLQAGVGAGNGLVWVGAAKGVLEAYGRDGVKRWQKQMSSDIVGAPVVKDGTLYVRTLDGTISALDPSDGKTRWTYEHTVQGLVLKSNAAVIVDRGGLFAGYPGARMVAINAMNGAVGWETEIATPKGATEIERMIDIAAQPVLYQNTICAVAWQGRVSCLEAQSGNPIWSREASSSEGIDTDGKNLYLTDDQGHMDAYDMGSGAIVWKQSTYLYRQVTAPLVANGMLAVGDYQGYVHFLSTDFGIERARVATDGSAIPNQPVLDGNRVLVQTKRGTVELIDAH